MKRLLLVEDDEDLGLQLCKSLRKAGYDVIAVTDGYAALQCDLQKIDLLITDVFMPGMNGLDLLMEIRELRPDLKTIAISGGGLYKDKEILKLASKTGVSQVLEKPFLDASLIETIAGLIGE